MATKKHNYTWNNHYALVHNGEICGEFGGFDCAYSYSNEGEIRLVFELVDNDMPVETVVASREDLTDLEESSLRANFKRKVKTKTRKSLDEIPYKEFTMDWH